MLPPKHWQPDRVLRLFFSILFGFGAGGLLFQSVDLIYRRNGIEPPQALMLCLGSLALHGVAIPALAWFVWGHGYTLASAFGLLGSRRWRAILLGALLAAGMLPLGYALLSAVRAALDAVGYPADAQEHVHLLLESKSLLVRGYIFTFSVIIAPWVEEAIFRGVLYPFIRDLGYPRFAFWGTAILFGLVHMNRAAFLPLTVFGLSLAWLYQRTGNLLAPVTAHVLFNLAPFVALAAGTDLK
ncbi:MAG: CPBP family intramembrane metalloprotease [Pedosphaera sp.]|nr:CPBP family intramembrane metalloprotease [Pedosphaera sp.]